MIDLYKYTNLDGKLPVLNLTPEEFIYIAWHSIPGAVSGVVMAIVLIYLRSLAIKSHGPNAPKMPGWISWPLYALRHVGVWYLLAVGVSTAVAAMPVSNELKHLVARAYGLLSIIQLGLVLTGIFTDACKTYLRRSQADGGRILLVNTAITVGNIIIWALMFVMMLNAFGVNVTSLVAGLGIGGIALAFATKNIVENILASFSMVLNPPFVIGDFIETDNVKGTVEEITLKNVLVRGLAGEQWIIPSGGLMNSRIRNMSRMRERRVELKFGVGYATMTPDRLERVPELVKAAIESYGMLVRFDRVHVNGFGDNLITVEAIYFVLSADVKAYMDIQQGVLFKVYRALQENGIVMALGFRVGTAGDYAGVEALLAGGEKPAAKPKKAGKS